MNNYYEYEEDWRGRARVAEAAVASMRLQIDDLKRQLNTAQAESANMAALLKRQNQRPPWTTVDQLRAELAELKPWIR